MLRSSFPLGRFFNVEVRMHLSFLLLLALAVAFSVGLRGSASRGFALWLALCFAVLVRETARSIAAAYAGLQLRAIFLLPVGGVMALSSRDGMALQANGKPRLNTRWVSASGPIANFGVGLLMLGFALGVDPHVQLLAQPWISLGHVLRSFIWTQLLMGAVSLLPTPTMPSRQILPTKEGAGKSVLAKVSAIGPAFSGTTAAALCMIIAGFVVPSVYWLAILGGFVLLYAQINSVQAQAGTEGDFIQVHEVMMTEFTLLSSSDTLRGALDQTVHSLHDIFPVVRGDRLVGSIARQTLAERLLTDGDGYLQGAMVRNLQIATPGEALVDALRRVSNVGSNEFIPVVEGDTMVGILTPQSLGRAVQQVKLLRPAPQHREQQP